MNPSASARRGYVWLAAIESGDGTHPKALNRPNECVDCGAGQPECPVNAISAAEDVPEAWLAPIELNASWFGAPVDTRAQVVRQILGSCCHYS
jgi:NAD-dependent dihydropyrimidine dehydrogenase PreA subunit